MGRLGGLESRALKLSAILVHYRTPALVEPAVEALVADAAAAGVELECVLVDNGSQPGDAEVFAALPLRCLTPGENLGYAGGVNAGVAATSGELIVAMNPDVVVQPGCLAALVAALRAGAAAAGPRFALDPERRWLLPPTEVRSRRAELAAVLAAGGIRSAGARGAWRRHAHSTWLATAPRRCYQLSGALLAFRRHAWQWIGPFDPGYQLYFEETDWLLRLRRAGLLAQLVPAAEAVHLYARSSLREPRAAAWFERSSRRFRRRWYGPLFAAGLERLDRLLASRHRLPPLRPPPAAGVARWLELSADAKGYPATGYRIADGDHQPLDLDAVLGPIRARLPPAAYVLRWVDAAGCELGAQRWSTADT